jgi:signal transduction histidine kinase/Tfp pilus assembly protein PilF
MAFTSSGISYAQQGAWVRALNYFLKSVQLKEELDDQQGMAALLSNIGIIHGKLNDEDRALRYHLLAAKSFQENSDRQGLAYSYNNIGVIYLNRGKYDQALEQFLTSLELKKELNDLPGLASTYVNIGITLARQGALVRARESYEQAIVLYQKLGDRHGTAEVYNRLGQLAFERTDYGKALEYGTLAQGMAAETGSRVVQRNAYKLCADAYTALGRPAEALGSFRRYTELKDSLFNEESSKIINEMTANYERELRERSERENDLLRKDAELQELELERRRALVERQEAEIALLNKGREVRELELNRQKAELREQDLLAQERENRIHLLEKDRELLAADRALKEAQLERQGLLRDGLILGSTLLLVIILLLALQYRQKQRSEEMFRQKSEELERLNAAISEQESLLRVQNRRLEELNTEKSDLMSMLAHDLRSPIGTISMLSEALSERDRPPEVTQRKVGQIRETADRVLAMVQDLLDVNRIESGARRFDAGPVDVLFTADRVLEGMRRSAERKGITILSETEAGLPQAQADAAALTQVLENLLSNAVKFSPPGSTVHLRLSAFPGWVRIEVADEGPGISDEDRPRLFTKYARLSAEPTGGEYSTGLGLSIVQKLVHEMKGEVRYISAEGEGARFVVELPTV